MAAPRLPGAAPATGRPDRTLAAGTVPAADDVAGAMHEVVAAAALLLAADGAG